MKTIKLFLLILPVVALAVFLGFWSAQNTHERMTRYMASEQYQIDKEKCLSRQRDEAARVHWE